MFFFKQKTAYEMRISDWSSDVCSSDLFPRIAFELLHAEADALGVAVDADDLHLDRVTDVDDFARVVDALVAHVGDMEQAVDAAEVDERTIIGDVLDRAFDDMAFFEVLDQARTLFGPRFLEGGKERRSAAQRVCKVWVGTCTLCL